ncbi:MAG: iron-containing alcohol dehydrogenase family protein [Promethearchaeia archaeon]
MEYENFDFGLVSPKVIFRRSGIGDLGKQVKEILKPNNKNLRVFLITGKTSLEKSGKLEEIRNILENEEIAWNQYQAGKEPTTDIVNTGKDLALEFESDIIVGVGGGSVLDTAKAIAGLTTKGGIVQEYHEGKEFIKPPKPFILSPTTSGTGSEITNNAVIKDPEKGIKKSIRGLWADLALLDPELTLSLPKKYTAYSGADALVQAIESLISKSRNYISDLFAQESIKYLGKNLPLVCDDLENIDLREKMLLGSFLGALSFANGKLGAVHGFAHPIGIQHDIPHGEICGLLLPYVMKYNLGIPHVEEKYAWIADLFHSQGILEDYGETPENLPTREKEKAKWTIQKIIDLFKYIGIPMHLKQLNIEETDLPAIVKDTKGSSLANNPRETDQESLERILKRAL